jgi:hypothetical protein
MQAIEALLCRNSFSAACLVEGGELLQARQIKNDESLGSVGRLIL